MNITAIGGSVNYSPTSYSQNSTASGSAQATSSTAESQASAGASATSSGGASQASAGSGSTSGSNSTSSASALYDPRDLNQDGIVTYAEEMQYAMTHSLAAQQSQSSTVQSYNQQGQIESSTGSSQSTISIYA